jgi:beta-N-acetylhexosaminidase
MTVGRPDVLGRLMLAFHGTTLPPAMSARLRGAPPAGISLFRYLNVASPGQVRELVDAVQAEAPSGLPFLVAIDQEGGQLRGLGPGSTPFPGLMALGAAGDVGLTRRVGVAIGHELRAVGVNVNYAPVADIASNPRNPSLGVRSFGGDADLVAAHVAAMVEGLESAGVAATLKHFPGKGEAVVDSHHDLPVIDRSIAELRERELAPFRAGIDAGASLVMSGHVAIPSVTGQDAATLSAAVMTRLLRHELGFSGVAISDAFDMDALAVGDGRYADASRGLNAGLDLLLLGGRSDTAAFDRALVAAETGGGLDAMAATAASARIASLRRRLAATSPPDPSIVGSQAHRALATEVAVRALTLVRDRDGAIPMRPAASDRILVVVPRPTDLTPADTSAAETLGLAAAVRRRHPATEELAVAHAPSDAEITLATERARAATHVIVASVSSSMEPAQARLVQALLAVGRPTVTAAMRTPWDLPTYPMAGTHLCTYSIVEPACEALAGALFGDFRPTGSLPVAP